ncbi:uncharacterized protein LOC131213518 [Anopheles bellator]|uniref:uncharacterized protein LOC131213518 n=1 Tax=Anopheles bellator TaxID=139047 RepID=UPI002648AE15|nr:uncharacterized protein LOC131213518 [Anopheles bellator]
MSNYRKLLAPATHCLLSNYRGIGFDGFGICPADIRNCSCKSYTGSETEIDCPSADPTVQLRIEPHQYAEVKCRRNQLHDFDQIPQLAIGDTKRLTIDDCPLPSGDLSILQFVEFLGTSQVKLLWLKNNAHNEHSAALVPHHFKGLNSLDRLAISNVKLHDIQPHLFEHLPNLTWLDMRDNVLNLPPTVFDSLPKLRILELNFNGLEYLQPRLLQNLSDLRLLSLWHNDLRSINRHTFEGVPRLERLDLSANKLENVAGDTFSVLPHLTEIALGYNRFRALPEGLFRANRELQKIKLAFQQAELATLPFDLFHNLPALKQVILEQNGLTSLPGTMFKGSPNITEINLASNRLRDLPGSLLHDQRSLQVLYLQSNQLTSLPDSLLQNTVELQALHLSHNQIEQLSAGFLRSLTKLDELYLAHNQLHYIDLQAFQHTINLRTLHMQNNQLTFDPFNTITVAEAEAEASDDLGLFVKNGTPFQYLHSLQELDLSHNALTTVFRDLLVNMHSIERLNLSWNNITSLTVANLQFLAQQVVVDLRHNHIFEINLADLERLVQLETEAPASRGDDAGGRLKAQARILLNDNPLNCNCIVYPFAQYVQRKLSSDVYERLQLVADELTCHGPEQLHGILIRDIPLRELLCELDPPSTEIRHCPDSCKCFIRPEDYGVVMKCNGQALMQLPELPVPSSFGYRFIELHVENNNITALPSLLPNARGWSEVQQLYAANNSIADISVEQLPKGLRVLDLTRNRLTKLDAPTIEWLSGDGGDENPTSMRLAQNEWVCDCETAPLLAFAHANQKHIEDFARLQCADGRHFDVTTISDLCTAETYTIVVLVCVAVSIVACLVALLSFLYYTYHLEVKVWLFKHGLCMWLGADEELDCEKQYDAFISYSHKDESFITEHLVPTLERHPMNFKICWHMRDWIPGEMIASQISSSVEKSRRTIIVLSSNFLTSLWGQLEFRTAHLQSLTEKRNRVIIIIYDNIGSIDELEPELRAYLKTNTYVRWGDPWFWDKVRYAMPHPAHMVRDGRKLGGLFMKQLQSSLDDKLELIKPTVTSATSVTVTEPPLESACSPITPPIVTSSPFTVSHDKTTATTPPFPTANGNRRQLVYPVGAGNGHINGAFVINTNAKQSDLKSTIRTNSAKQLQHSIMSCTFRFLIVALVTQLTTGSLECPPRCSCPQLHGGIEKQQIRCPSFQLDIDYSISHVKVHCSKDNGYDFESIPSLTSSENTSFLQLTYSNCAIPSNRSLAATLEFLGPGAMEKLEKLFFVGNGYNAHSAPLTAVLFDELPALHTVSLKSATAQPIPDDDLFRHVPLLSWLDLREYRYDLPATLLTNLTQLSVLELTHTTLQSLPDGLLQDLPNLEKLNMFANRLQRLQSLSGSPRLKNIDVSGNELSILPPDLFGGLTHLETVQLHYNRITELPNGLLQDQTHLKSISFANNQLTVLPATLFSATTVLSELDLSGNRLAALPPYLLQHQVGLQELRLSHNALSGELPDALLRNTTKLRVLDLSDNQLETINKNVFASLSALEELYMGHNRLRVIDLYAFREQSVLRMLSLSHNNLSFYEGDTSIAYVDGKALLIHRTPFDTIKKLAHLDLSHNALRTVFATFADFMPLLERLNLSRNNVTTIDFGDFAFSSKRLQELDLRGNKLQTINFSTHRTSNTRSLPKRVLLNDNPLQCDCQVHAFIRYVQVVTEEVRFVTDELRCASPERLHNTPVKDVSPMDLLCEAAGKGCPVGCKCYSRPEDRYAIIDCAQRNLTEVPLLPAPYNILKSSFIELHLEKNALPELREPKLRVEEVNETGWRHVRRLYVSDNHIAVVEAASLPTQLETLDLSGNVLTQLEEPVLSALGRIASLRLSRNAWSCSCDAPQFVSFAHTQRKRINDFATLNCADGAPLETTTTETVCAEKTRRLIFSCVALAIVALVAALLTLLYHRYRLEVKVWLFTHNIFHWLTDDGEERDAGKLYDAFVSYSHVDESFIADHLVPRLEQHPPRFRLCWHVRDFTPGEMISTQITKAVEDSRRTIIVLSKNYLKSVWGKMEFRTAYLQSVSEQRNRVIAIIYEDIGNIDELDADLRAFLRSTTYLQWGDTWFWQKLTYAMPRPPKNVTDGRRYNLDQNLQMASTGKLKMTADLEMVQTEPESDKVIEPQLTIDRMANAEEALVQNGATKQAFTISNGLL